MPQTHQTNLMHSDGCRDDNGHTLMKIEDIEAILAEKDHAPEFCAVSFLPLCRYTDLYVT